MITKQHPEMLLECPVFRFLGKWNFRKRLCTCCMGLIRPLMDSLSSHVLLFDHICTSFWSEIIVGERHAEYSVKHPDLQSSRLQLHPLHKFHCSVKRVKSAVKWVTWWWSQCCYWRWKHECSINVNSKYCWCQKLACIFFFVFSSLIWY